MLGHSLLPLVRGEDDVPREVVFAELPKALEHNLFKDKFYKIKGNYFHAMIKDRVKLISATNKKTGGVTMEIYDLEKDPGETNNLALVEPERFKEEREEMEAFFNNLSLFHETKSVEGTNIPEDMSKLMKALGYVQ